MAGVGPNSLPVDEFNDPDNWLHIPDFGVRPEDVDYEGFAYPILGPGGGGELAIAIRDVVRGLRTLARKDFESLQAVHTAYGAALDVLYPLDADGALIEPTSSVALSARQVAAVRYTLISQDLEGAVQAIAGRRKTRGGYERSATAVASAAGVMMDWLLQAPVRIDAERLERMRRGSVRGGAASARTRRASSRVPSPVCLRKLRDELIGGGKNARNVAGILAQRFGCSADHIRKTLKKQD